jgi:hypothetical protein
MGVIMSKTPLSVVNFLKNHDVIRCRLSITLLVKNLGPITSNQALYFYGKPSQENSNIDSFNGFKFKKLAKLAYSIKINRFILYFHQSRVDSLSANKLKQLIFKRK